MNIPRETHCLQCDLLLGNPNNRHTLEAHQENDLSVGTVSTFIPARDFKHNFPGSCLMDHKRIQGISLQETARSRTRRRRFSSSDSETIFGKGGENENTESIEKFLSLCLQQFENRLSCSQNGTRGQNVTVNNLQEDWASFNKRNTSDAPNPFSFKGTGLTGRSCTYCNREMRTGAHELNHHFEVCPKFPLECPNLCGKMEVPRDELSSHIMDGCAEATETCSYHNIGCSFQGSKANFTNHLEKNIDDHLQLACEVIEDQKIELDRQAERIRLQDEAIVQLNDTIVKIKALFDEQVKLRENQDNAINKLTEQLKEHKKMYNKMENEMKMKLEETEKRNRDINNNTNNIGDLVRYPGLNGYGELIWKISSFGKRISRIKTGRSEDPVCSEPFYTSAFGYKVSCWAYLNGRGKEMGQSLSIYACVMNGEYDAVLEWPIKPRYTFILLDQNPDVEKRKDIVRVRKVHDFRRDDVRRKGIDRPRRDERAIIVGFDDFVSLEKLEEGDYLAEDSLFIRILVEIAEH